MTTSKRTTRSSSGTAQTQTDAAIAGKARARRAKASSHATSPSQPEDRIAAIAKAAYFRSEHRGFVSGHELEDWLAAENEVNQGLLGEGRAS